MKSTIVKTRRRQKKIEKKETKPRVINHQKGTFENITPLEEIFSEKKIFENMTKEKLAKIKLNELSIEYGKIKSKLESSKNEIKNSFKCQDKLDEFGNNCFLFLLKNRISKY